MTTSSTARHRPCVTLLPEGPLEEATIDAVEEANLRSLYGYWQRIRGARPVPLRTDFDPLDVPKLLKDLFLVEVHGADPPWRFRYRLAGTGISDFVGADYTGRFIDEVFPSPARAIVQRFYSAPVRCRRPVYSSTRLVVPGSTFPKQISRLILPLTSDGQRIDLLVSGQHYNREQRPLSKITYLSDYELERMFAIRPQ